MNTDSDSNSNPVPDRIHEGSPLKPDDSLVDGKFLVPKRKLPGEYRSEEPFISEQSIAKEEKTPVPYPIFDQVYLAKNIGSALLIAFPILIVGGFFSCIGGQTIRIAPTLSSEVMLVLLVLTLALPLGILIFLALDASAKQTSIWSSNLPGQIILLLLATVLLGTCLVQNVFTARSL